MSSGPDISVRQGSPFQHSEESGDYMAMDQDRSGVEGVGDFADRTSDVYLQSEDDVTRLLYLVSQYESWRVRNGLYLTELGSDDWALLAQLLPTLTSGVGVVITSNSTSHPAQETLRQLWDKTEYWWEVNNEKYEKSDDENFDKMLNKYFK